jgi:hypothetical protein
MRNQSLFPQIFELLPSSSGLENNCGGNREDYSKRCCPFVSSPSIVPLKPHQYHRDNLGDCGYRRSAAYFHQFLKTKKSRLNSNDNPNFCPDFNTLYVFTDGKKSKWVPARKPAIKYPKTKGCFSF